MTEGMPAFKSKTMQEPGLKKRLWKSLKQIQTTERNLFGNNTSAVLCKSILFNFKLKNLTCATVAHKSC